MHNLLDHHCLNSQDFCYSLEKFFEGLKIIDGWCWGQCDSFIREERDSFGRQEKVTEVSLKPPLLLHQNSSSFDEGALPTKANKDWDCLLGHMKGLHSGT